MKKSNPVRTATSDFAEFCHREDPEYAQRDDKFQCPCCDCFTLSGVGQYDICPVCFWEDDGTTGEHGFSPNGCTLTVARQNYLTFGADTKRNVPHVREPYPDELP